MDSLTNLAIEAKTPNQITHEDDFGIAGNKGWMQKQ